MNLYYIAILPDDDICAEVLDMKMQFKDRYNATQAFKSPAHITLQMPFKRKACMERELTQCLANFSVVQDPFQVTLDGFGHFSDKVIFISVGECAHLSELKSGLSGVLGSELGFLENELSFNFHPHMTLAHRDLSPENFKMAWSEFKNRSYRAVFEVSSISLLRHNGRLWDVIANFPFKSSVASSHQLK